MAKRIKIIGNALIVEDTVSGKIDISEPTKDVYFDNEQLNSGYIVITQKDGARSIDSTIGNKILLTNAVNAKDVVFNETTFRSFMNYNVGISRFTEDYYLNVQKGNILGHSMVHKFGSIQNVGATLQSVTTSKSYPTPKVLTSLEIVSSSANDTSTGTGIRSIELCCTSDVNGAWTEQIITVVPNGLTAVALPNTVYRITGMKALTSGTYASQSAPSHNSTITLRVASAGATWHLLDSIGGFGLSQSEIGAYTISKGFTGYFLNYNVAVEATKNANILLFTRSGADIVSAPYSTMKVKALDRNLDGNNTIDANSPLLTLQGATDVGFMASATTGTTDVSVNFEILLVENGF